MKPGLNGLKAATPLVITLTSEIPSLRRGENYFHREKAINHKDCCVFGVVG